MGLDENTIIFFASDNGNSSHGYQDRYLKDKNSPSLDVFFNLKSPTRGKKGDTYDGAFHVPAMARWPGHIAPNQVNDHIWAFWDFLPTASEIAGVEPPSDIDGISILPALLGKGKQKQHDYLYWEYKQAQVIRDGKWFAHRASGKQVELYDLISDPQQSKDLSNKNSDIVKKMKQIMLEAHTPSDVWPSPGETPEAFKKRLLANNISARPDNTAVY